MWIKSSILLQTLLVGLKSGDDDGDVMYDLGSDERMTWPQQPRLTPIPDHNDYPTMARFIVHNANWTSVGYISAQPSTAGRALADKFSVADGMIEAGTGTPYFYVSRLQAAVTDLLDNNADCSLMMGLQQTQLCKERDWDDQDPRCAHLILTGKFKVLGKDSAEYARAENALFSRHPSFRTLPANHHFFVAKYDIETITLQDFFGGPINVPLDDYFNVKNSAFKLMRGWGRRKSRSGWSSRDWEPVDNNYLVVN